MQERGESGPVSDVRTLLVVAAEGEYRAVMAGLGRGEGVGGVRASAAWQVVNAGGGVGVLMTGIGKVNAAGATVLALSKEGVRRVINVGVAGLLPGGGGGGDAEGVLGIGSVVVGSSSVYADEGLVTPTGFQTTAEMGFAMGPFPDPAVPASDGLLRLVRSMGDAEGAIATVSTCSGTDERAAEVRGRTGAIAEGMEGAAVGHAVARWNALDGAAGVGVEFVEVRVISNTAGDRPKQRWDLRAAFERLSTLVGEIARV
ncbi:MAG: futalosine hydrolase [Phycisphaeraceae bacterium]|nr:futalosine hydrolase [Phycisphaeraceae bacterium]